MLSEYTDILDHMESTNNVPIRLRRGRTGRKNCQEWCFRFHKAFEPLGLLTPDLKDYMPTMAEFLMSMLWAIGPRSARINEVVVSPDVICAVAILYRKKFGIVEPSGPDAMEVSS